MLFLVWTRIGKEARIVGFLILAREMVGAGDSASEAEGRTVMVKDFSLVAAGGVQYCTLGFGPDVPFGNLAKSS